jgi:hypothetical protein
MKVLSSKCVSGTEWHYFVPRAQMPASIMAAWQTGGIQYAFEVAADGQGSLIVLRPEDRAAAKGGDRAAGPHVSDVD